VVDAQWRALESEISWELAPDDTSFLLLAALAASRVWTPEHRAAIQAQIVREWESGRLAVAPARSRLTRFDLLVNVELGSRVRALRRRVRALATREISDEVLRELERRERYAALLHELGAEPATHDSGQWTVTDTRFGPFLARRDELGAATGFFTSHEALARAVGLHLRLPSGFAVQVGNEDTDFGPTATEAGVRVRNATELPGTALVFQLRSKDPESIVRAARARAGTARIALLVLAALSATAGVATFGVLRRERRLATLKTGFIAGVSHDLRTPLASILLMAENLESERVSGDAARKRYYGAIRREADRLRRLVDDVLDFSRIERGEHTKLCVEEVDLGRFVDDLAAQARAKVEARGLRFELDRGAIDSGGALDPDAVRRALWNLVDNAVTHSGTDVVRLHAQLRDARTLVLAVSDAGRGVPPACREEIFGPFAQLDPLNGHVAGTGLGLAIVREIARAHGGEASVRTTADGRGARFELHIGLNGVEADD